MCTRREGVIENRLMQKVRLRLGNPRLMQVHSECDEMRS